jgi:1-acyl-sn-glycerol-3-phosphate acyltransferase
VAPKERNKVDQLKTGFYYIALKANVPIIPVAFNFGKKVNLGTPLMPTGNIDEELIILKSILKE